MTFPRFSFLNLMTKMIVLMLILVCDDDDDDDVIRHKKKMLRCTFNGDYYSTSKIGAIFPHPFKLRILNIRRMLDFLNLNLSATHY